jgi:hypothetical protein
MYTPLKIKERATALLHLFRFAIVLFFSMLKNFLLEKK